MGNNYSISCIPKEERPREKLLKYGAGILTNSELLAIIIGVGSREDSALTLAQKVLYRNNKGVLNIAEAEAEDLKVFKGINDAKAAKIIAVAELSKRISSEKVDKTKITSPEGVVALLSEEMRHLKREVFKVVLLDVKNNILCVENISEGTISSAIVYPRDVFSRAIKSNCTSIILVHNHPSGESKPSIEDKSVTERLVKSGKILGIEIIDHIIIGDKEYYSFKEHGYI